MALYNKALILRKLRRISDAKSAFKQYIEMFPYSSRNVNAAAYLNQMGDFTYRVHTLGKRRVMGKKIEFDNQKNELTSQSLETLRKIGAMIKNNAELTLHIIAYEKNNTDIVKEKALKIKTYLLNYFRTINRQRIKTSWFDSPERLKIAGHSWQLVNSINLFAIPKQKK